MDYKFFKKLLKGIRHTIFHPQWLAFKTDKRQYDTIGRAAKGVVLDIGCADQFIKKYLSHGVEYVGLDYFQTASEWYETTPDIFGDAQCLPVTTNAVDCVLLLDVLEHIPDPDRCLSEISRVLKDNGTLILQIPFLYPIHDAPLDFQRWTLYGLTNLMDKHGFNNKRVVCMGKGVETAGLLLNISLCKLVSQWIHKNSLSAMLIPVLGLLIVIVNVLCALLAIVSIKDNFMPYGYLLFMEKKP